MIANITRRLMLRRSATAAVVGAAASLPTIARSDEAADHPPARGNLGCVMLDGERVWFDPDDWDVEHGAAIVVIHGSDLKVATASREAGDRSSDHKWRRTFIAHDSGFYGPGVSERAQVRVVGRVIAMQTVGGA